MWIRTHTHTHIYIYIYIYTSTYICIYVYMIFKDPKMPETQHSIPITEICRKPSLCPPPLSESTAKRKALNPYSLLCSPKSPSPKLKAPSGVAWQSCWAWTTGTIEAGCGLGWSGAVAAGLDRYRRCLACKCPGCVTAGFIARYVHACFLDEQRSSWAESLKSGSDPF